MEQPVNGFHKVMKESLGKRGKIQEIPEKDLRNPSMMAAKKLQTKRRSLKLQSQKEPNWNAPNVVNFTYPVGGTKVMLTIV